MLLPAILCSFAAFAVLHSRAASDTDEAYTNSWVVEVDGGDEVANAVALRHGFVNLGMVRKAYCLHAVAAVKNGSIVFREY